MCFVFALSSSVNRRSKTSALSNSEHFGLDAAMNGPPESAYARGTQAKSQHWLLCGLAYAVWHLTTFENAADVCFFGGVCAPLDAWLASHAPQTPPPAELETLPCSALAYICQATLPSDGPQTSTPNPDLK